MVISYIIISWSVLIVAFVGKFAQGTQKMIKPSIVISIASIDIAHGHIG